MTDVRNARHAVKVLVQPATPEARRARDAAKILVVPPTPEVRRARQALKVLVQTGVDPNASEWSKRVKTTSPLWWWKADLPSGFMSGGESWQFWPDETGHGYNSDRFVGSVSRRQPLIPSAAWNEWANVVVDAGVSLSFPVGAGSGDPVFGSTGTVLMVFKRVVPDPTDLTSGSYFLQRGDNELYLQVDSDPAKQNLTLVANGGTVTDAITKSQYNDGQPHVLVLRWGGGSVQLLWDWTVVASVAKTIPAAASGYGWYFQAGGHAYAGQEVVYDDTVFWSRRLTDADLAGLQTAYLAPRPPRTGPTVTWWDGTTEQTATVEGWWDGTTIQPVTVEGWWDGTTIQPLA